MSDRSERYYVVKRRDGHKGPDKYFNPADKQWTKLNPSILREDRTGADRGAEDASRHGPDPSRPLPVKTIPVRIVEDDD
jgi:hypothetical protein